MRILFVSLALAAAACGPTTTSTTSTQSSGPGPEAVVQAIYTAAVAREARNQATNSEDLPFTSGLASDYARAEAVASQRDEPFIDGDLVLDCQDCSPVSDLHITTPTPPANGQAVVQAQFKVAGDDRTVLWDMQETPQGWRIDNIRGNDGYNLRTQIQQELRPLPASGQTH